MYTVILTNERIESSLSYLNNFELKFYLSIKMLKKWFQKNDLYAKKREVTHYMMDKGQLHVPFNMTTGK
jgi:hypothetical protein